jgi:cytoskeleton protein RodZ
VLQHRKRILTGLPSGQASALGSLASEPASRVGADLQTARLNLGWDIAAVAASLRIRRPYLEALEEGRLGDIPGTAYAVAFLRSYARILGLDVEEMTRRFRQETTEVNRRPELSFPAPVPERGVPATALVLIGAVLAIAAYGAWYKLSSDTGRLNDPVPPVPARLAPLADAGSASPQVASILPGPVTPPPGRVDPMAGAYNLPAPPAPPAAPTDGNPASPAGTGSGNPATATSPATPAPAANEDGRVVLRARGDSWTQVRDKQGTILLNRVMKAGDSWPVPAKPSLLLTTGNAGALDIVLDGTALPSLGANGVVRRDLPLDPDLLKAARPLTGTAAGGMSAASPAPASAATPILGTPGSNSSASPGSNSLASPGSTNRPSAQ